MPHTFIDGTGDTCGGLIRDYLREVWSLAVDHRCPTRFQEGENVISCVINETAVKDADCLSMQDFVTFEQSSMVKCYIPSFNSSLCGIPVQKPSAGSCWCNGRHGDIFEYIFVYQANRSRDDGAQMECKICYDPKKQLDMTSSSSCRRMSFDNPDSGSVVTGANLHAIISLIIPVFVI